MRVCFFRSHKAREGLLADAFVAGVAKHGDSGEIRLTEGLDGIAKGFDVVVMIGVKSKDIFERHRDAGIHVVYLDKGYQRHIQHAAPVRLWEYWRVAVDGHNPTRYLMATDRPDDRAEAMSFSLKPWRKSGKHIVFAGSSAKYHEFYDLPDPTTYAKSVIRQIRRLAPGREILYRPKPSWHDAVPIKGSTWSGRGQTLAEVLVGAHALVTHGSNSCFEAVCAGVPCVVLGEGVARPVSSTEVSEIESPRLAPMGERQQWLANVAYQEWTMPEFESGQAWAVIRSQIGRV